MKFGTMMQQVLETVRATIGFNPVAWICYAERMRRRVSAFAPFPAPAADAPRWLVVVMPWLGTAIPWLSIDVGLLLSMRGAHVTFAIDDSRFGPNPIRFTAVLRAIRRVLAIVSRTHDVVLLSDIAPQQLDADAHKRVDELARLNAVWELRGEMVETGRAAIEAENRSRIGASHRAIAGLFATKPFDAMFVPGGVFGTSGLWVALARMAGIRVASYDNGGFGTWLTAADGLACHLGDVPRAVVQLRDRLGSDAASRAQVLAAAETEMAQRRGGTDIFGYQVKGSAGGHSGIAGGILLALNSSWDSAALGIHEVFATNRDWIVASVRHLLENSDAPVIVRQHPAERLAFATTTDGYAALLKTNFGDHPRLHFIAAADPVNSYALLEQVAAVVVHSSTIGVEAAAIGRPVITPSRSYYADLGFVWATRSSEDYFAVLSKATTGELVVTEAMRDEARLCYYITQVCNWIHSAFNPADFRQWSRQSIAHWQEEPATQRMIDSLLGNIPVAILNHDAMSAPSAS